MGCGLSKQEEEDEVDVVALCRERKKLLKLAVERRYAFADAQFKYNQSLHAVAMALRLFVARHSSAFPPFLITFPPNQTHESNPMFLQQTPTESTLQTIQLEETQNEDEGFKEDEDEEEICDHFYDEEGPTPEREFGWDFFYPFDEIKTELLKGFNKNCEEEEDSKAVREKEGNPELEAVNLKNGIEEKKEYVPIKGRDLLEALKEVEEHFLRAYESGLDVSRMLEANRVQAQSGLDEIKESSNKLIRSLTWHRSASFRSPSSRSLLSSASISSSRWTEFKADVFDEFGMKAGSHSLTLGRLYAWEKKLYEEVKAEEETRKLYEKKCLRLRKPNTTDKSSAEVKELHSRVSVAIRSMESISHRIDKLRDEELQPQLLELLHGLMTNWKAMLESHEAQNCVMVQVKHINCPSYGKFSSDLHRLATLQLEAELDNWRTCFDAYISAQRSYVEALCGWLSKFVAPELCHYSISGPPLLRTCQAWLAWLEKLPDKAVTYAMRSFGKDIHALRNQQGNEQQQKRKVDGLAKELEKKNQAFQRAESQASVRDRIEYLAEGKSLLDMLKKRLDEEKEKHISSMQKTQQITVSGFQTGFSSVFGSLSEFSDLTVTMYADLITHISNRNTADENDSDVHMIN